MIHALSHLLIYSTHISHPTHLQRTSIVLASQNLYSLDHMLKQAYLEVVLALFTPKCVLYKMEN